MMKDRIIKNIVKRKNNIITEVKFKNSNRQESAGTRVIQNKDFITLQML